MKIRLLIMLFCLSQVAWAQEEASNRLRIGGTLRGKYEYQTEEGEGRFQVRTARVSVQGKVTPIVEYKAEIDLCDEGTIKMLDAYTRLSPWKSFQFTIGQMRVPFTIDAHRSPHLQYFANRSFIAKQVGNVRDVGAMAGYTFHVGFPIRIQAGLFNGSGLTGQKDYWTKGVNYSAKTQFYFPFNVDLETSVQKIKPDAHTVMMYDAGLTFHYRNFLAEAEYLYKTYAHHAYKNVHAVNTFMNYDIPVRRKNSMIKKVSPLVRYDFMTDHSDGKHYLDAQESGQGMLATTDYQRHRVTGGVTLSLATPFVSDIRINYEKYFYRDAGLPKTSERDKIVVEFMTRF
jgi:hypothetical protein